jgi:hypothetical protein
MLGHQLRACLVMQEAGPGPAGATEGRRRYLQALAPKLPLSCASCGDKAASWEELTRHTM